MTDAEFEQIQKECRDYIARTSFPEPATADPDDWGTHHAEYGASQH